MNVLQQDKVVKHHHLNVIKLLLKLDVLKILTLNHVCGKMVNVYHIHNVLIIQKLHLKNVNNMVKNVFQMDKHVEL